MKYTLSSEFLKIGLIFGIVIISIISYGLLHNPKNSIDLIHDAGWLRSDYAETTFDSVHFTASDQMITHKDGSRSQPNPPVSISGQHLQVTGDFKITTTFSGIDGQASFRLYASPPIIYDEWRLESPSVDVTIDTLKKTITTRIWDGSASTPMDIRTYSVSLSDRTTMTLEHNGNQITISTDHHILGSIPDHSIFDAGTIWFGIDCSASQTGCTLSELTAEAIGKGQVESIPAPALQVSAHDPNSLRNLATSNPRQIKIGTAIAGVPLFTDAQYRQIALDQFSIWTPENAMKPQFIHPQPTVYTFAEADQLVDAGLKNGITIHGHTLVYPQSSPEWMLQSPVDERKNILMSHIDTVVSHFRGKVAEWDVVNEPFSQRNAPYKDNGTGLEPNIWLEAMGEEYIDLAFITAHKADPSAKLYLNDYGVENNGRHWDAFLSLIKRLKQRNVPIDGVGFEAHIYNDGDYIHTEELKEHMEILAKLGLLTRISEIDVTGDDPQEQINQYVNALDICLRAPNCTSYTTWGITDRYGSTTRSDRYPLVYGTSLLWDTDMHIKPAYTALQKRLRNNY